MTQTQKKKTPDFIQWEVSFDIKDVKFIDSIWVSALNEKEAKKNALEALEVFNLEKNQIIDFSIRKLDDIVHRP